MQYVAVAVAALLLVAGAIRLWPKVQAKTDQALDSGGLSAFEVELKRIAGYDAQIMELQNARAAAVSRFKAAQAAVQGLVVT